MAEVNRHLTDPDLDDVDHALGRPLAPLTGTTRNHFATEADGPAADRMRRSPWWTPVGDAHGCSFFAVTAAGREALDRHLRSRPCRHRAFRVVMDGGEPHTVIATSRSGARYLAFLDRREVDPDIRFGDFCRRSRVTAAGGA